MVKCVPNMACHGWLYSLLCEGTEPCVRRHQMGWGLEATPGANILRGTNPRASAVAWRDGREVLE